MKKRIFGLLLILTIIVFTGFSAKRGCDCSQSVYSGNSYAAYEKCYMLEVGFPVFFCCVPGNRICCRKSTQPDPTIKGCYEWHEKACQTGLPAAD